jgi:hypothetical protein
LVSIKKNKKKITKIIKLTQIYYFQKLTEVVITKEVAINPPKSLKLPVRLANTGRMTKNRQKFWHEKQSLFLPICK